MGAIVKGFVVWTVGLTVLFGSPAVTLAAMKFVVGKLYCVCFCYSEQAGQGKDIGWDYEGKACNLSDLNDCRITLDNKTYSGTLRSCRDCKAYTSVLTQKFLYSYL